MVQRYNTLAEVGRKPRYRPGLIVRRGRLAAPFFLLAGGLNRLCGWTIAIGDVIIMILKK